MNFFKSIEGLKAIEDGLVEGYASVFGKIDSYGDTIAPTAYDKVIEEKQIPLMFFNHDSSEIPIGKWTSISKDDIGLKVIGQLDLSQQKAQEVYNAVKFGSISGLSVGMSVNPEQYEKLDENCWIIKEVKKLYEVSIVNFPADDFARILNCKSINFDACNNVTDFEKRLRDAGCSRNEAKSLISVAKRVLINQREADEKADEDMICKRIDSILEKLGK